MALNKVGMGCRQGPDLFSALSMAQLKKAAVPVGERRPLSLVLQSGRRFRTLFLLQDLEALPSECGPGDASEPHVTGHLPDMLPRLAEHHHPRLDVGAETRPAAGVGVKEANLPELLDGGRKFGPSRKDDMVLIRVGMNLLEQTFRFLSRRYGGYVDLKEKAAPYLCAFAFHQLGQFFVQSVCYFFGHGTCAAM